MGSLTMNVKKLLQRWKQRRLERPKIREKIANYIKMVAGDYKVSALEAVQDMKDKPLKSTVYLSIVGTLIAMLKTNPDEEHYRSRLVESVVDIGQVGNRLRNQHSAETVGNLHDSYEGGTLIYTNLIVCSLIRTNPYPKHMDLYMSKCKHLRPSWTRFHESIVDVGVFGRWIYLEKTMQDYDVNPDEWTENDLTKQKSLTI